MQIKPQQQSEEEGFFPDRIEIRQYSFRNTNGYFHSGRNNSQGVLFSTRYLSGNGFMIKQPPQAIKPIFECPIQTNQPKPQKRKKNTIKPQHPYLLYAKNQDYQLIYSKGKGGPITNQIQFIKNQIILENIGGNNLMQSKGVKQFHANSQKSKSQTLIIDSRFECGNLHCAFKHTKINQYVGFIQNDTNSLGYNQWFYFSIQNNKANLKYKFKIVNFKKKHSFFKYGYLPAVFSRTQAQKTGDGWTRKGNNVVYEQSPIFVPSQPDVKYYCLTFQLTFQHENDHILIAMGLPYSYTKMMNFLDNCLPKEPENIQFSTSSICKSICGNDVPEVTITSTEGVQNKKMIVIMARQHPGEVWSSYMAQGMINELLSPSEQTKWLLDNYIFKIYPMINVDGVIYGNFRCDVTGVDLNRRWKETSKVFYPQIYHIKKKITEYHKRYKIDLCYDLHGHSKDYNIFCYSCKSNVYTCRILPLMISKINSDFHFPSCTFGISPYKQTTARAAIFKIVRNQNVLTIQSSFFGAKDKNKIRNFNPQDIYQMGCDILKASRHFLDKNSQDFERTKKQIQQRIKEFLEYDKINENNPGSDSQPSADQIDFETKANKIFCPNINLNTKQNKTKSKSPSPRKKKKGIFIEKQSDDESQEAKKQKNKLTLNNNKVDFKEIPLYKRSSKAIHGQKAPENKQNDITISYSEDKEFVTVEKNSTHQYQTIQGYSSKQSHIGDKNKKKHFSINHSFDGVKSKKKSNHPIKPRFQNLGHNEQEKDDEFTEKRQSETKMQSKKELPRNFTKRFQKFIPISMLSHQFKTDPFQQDLYNQDQSSLINTLLENKKKIEVEKIKRDVQKSTYIVERQGKIKSKGQKKKDNIVDFRKFKENERLSKQIRHLNTSQKYRYVP